MRSAVAALRRLVDWAHHGEEALVRRRSIPQCRPLLPASALTVCFSAPPVFFQGHPGFSTREFTGMGLSGDPPTC